MPGYTNVENIATERSWNGYGYECYLCHREFGSLTGLNQHLKSPAHEQNLYKCPNRACGREYKLLSGLVQHFESESCGVMKFSVVQQQARAGVNNMFGRMISYWFLGDVDNGAESMCEFPFLSGYFQVWWFGLGSRRLCVGLRIELEVRRTQELS